MALTPCPLVLDNIHQAHNKVRIPMNKIWMVSSILVITAAFACSDDSTAIQDSAPLPADVGADAPLPDVLVLDTALPDARPPDTLALDSLPPDTLNPAYIPPGTWVTLSAGTFTMGSPKGEPCREPFTPKETPHPVTLTRKLVIQTTEVTQNQFKSVMLYSSPKFSTCGGDCPMESVSWHEAAAYCNTLSKNKGLSQCYACTGSASAVSCAEATAYTGTKIYTCPGYRLPTEAEWEYAYRAGTNTALYNGPISTCSGNDANANLIGWYDKNATNTTRPVAKKQPNNWGLYDMAGNVGEWCHDWIEANPGSTPETDPVAKGSSSDPYRVFRGGTWTGDAQRLRGAWRDCNPPAKGFSHVGFRCVMSK